MAVTLNDKYLKGVVNADELKGMKPMVKVAHEMIENKSGLGNDFLGWVDLPVNYDKEEFERIKKAAAKIKADSEVLIVIGIGGSYLGARAAIELLRSTLYNSLAKDTPKIFFAGNSISPTYLNEVIELVKDKDFSVNIISKSGTSLHSHSEYSEKCSKKSTARTAQRAEFTQLRTRQREHSRSLQTLRVMKHSLSPMMSADVSRYLQR